MKTNLKEYKTVAQKAEKLMAALIQEKKSGNPITIACIELERALAALKGKN